MYLYAYLINTLFSNYIYITYTTGRRKGSNTNHVGLAVQRTVKKKCSSLSSNSARVSVVSIGTNISSLLFLSKRRAGTCPVGSANV